MTSVSPPVSRSMAGHMSPGAGGGEGSVSQTPPLPSTALEYWHSELGIAQNTGVDSWTGRIVGIPLPFNNARPAYGASGTDFNGRSVVQCSLTASLRATALATVCASGSRPYLYSVFNYRASPATDNTFQMFCMGVSGVFDDMSLRWIRGSSGTTNTFGASGAWPATTVLSPMDLLPHTSQVWADGTNFNVQLDNTLVQSASVAALGENVTAIGIGILASGTSQRSATNHAFHLICSAKPSAGEIAALRAWSLAYWGV